jgi:hypothetical protein
MPYEASGAVTLETTTPNGSASISVMVTPTAPAILAVISGNNVAVQFVLDGVVVQPFYAGVAPGFAG